MEASSVIFGAWPQTGSQPEPLPWVVLARDECGTLLITRDVVEQWPYADFADSVAWEDSALRAWLNGPFLQRAFSDADRARINGELTCLTPDEARQLFDADADRATRTTAYAAARKADAWWWLRGQGGRADHAACVLPSGHVGTYGSPMHCINGVRPVLWLAGDDEPAAEPAQVLRIQHANTAQALRYGDTAAAAQLLEAGDPLTEDGLRIALTSGFVGEQAFGELLSGGALSPAAIDALWRAARRNKEAVRAVARCADLDAFTRKAQLLEALATFGLAAEMDRLLGHDDYFSADAVDAALAAADPEDLETRAFLLSRKGESAADDDPFAAFEL